MQSVVVAPDHGHREGHGREPIRRYSRASWKPPGRLRDHGLRIGELDPGGACSIADVAGVQVGHVTVHRDEPDPPAGRGIARSGVTAILPGGPETLSAQPVSAGVAVLNGAGEMTGAVEISEWGLLQTPVYLTATMSVGRVLDGAVAAAVAADPGVGVDQVVIPVVAECDDSWLNDARVVQVEAADAARALEDAARGGPVAQGAVGAGTGMMCFEWKGGIGTASRMTEANGSMVGVLVLANFGVRADLRVDGVPVGRLLGGGEAGGARGARRGAASRSSRPTLRCPRISSRALPAEPASAWPAPGLSPITEAARSSSPSRRCGRRRLPPGVPDEDLDPFFLATVDATEEAVLNALWSAERTEGREGRVVEALPHDDVLELLDWHGRLER